MACPGQEDACAAALRKLCYEAQLAHPDKPGASLPAALGAIGQLLKRKTYSGLKTFVRNQRPHEFAVINLKKGQYVACLTLPAAGAAGNAGSLSCGLCGISCSSAFNLQQHLEGKAHQAKAASEEGRLWCSLCSTRSPNAAAQAAHVRGARHKAALLQRSNAAGGALGASQEGVEVALQPAEITGLAPGQVKVASLLITNSGHAVVRVAAVSQMRAVPGVVVSSMADGQCLWPGGSRAVAVTITPKGLGYIYSLLVVDLGSFCVSCLLSAACDGGDPIARELAPSAPYAPKRPPPNEARLEIVPGEKPARHRSSWARPPGAHEVPDWLRSALRAGELWRVQEELDKAANGAELHAKRMALMVWLEELQQERDVRQYDIDGAQLESTPGGRLLALKVPGLAESRPSVMLGDRLYVRRSDGERREWEGYVHAVRLDEVLLRFSSAFHSAHIDGSRCRVRFSIKRSSFVFMHEALSLVQYRQLPEQLLLPMGVQCEVAHRVATHPAKQAVAWVNPFLNQEQRGAVEAVLRGGHAPAPYLVFGPPGTGKTSTLVEAAVQVLRTQPFARVLLLAPSNTAADQLALRLMGPAAGRPKSEMLRVNAYQRPSSDVPREVMDISTYVDQIGAGSGYFKLPETAQVVSKRAVVATCVMASKIYAQGLFSGWFTHIFMDEAGHAEEPLALAGIAGLAGPNTRVVLVGDPRQLGPIIHSRLARDAGLGTSWMERLLGRAPYAPDAQGCYDARFITQLVRNYRSHPDLLTLPSTLFYGGRLVACADPVVTHSVLQSGFELPNQRFPLLFHGLVGKDEREGNSPSWFNSMEVLQVVRYIEKLRAVRRNPISTADIGVVTPYHKQVQKLRRAFSSKGMDGVMVGSVEQFQGQERKVIIISTVRSTSEYVDFDLKHRLGFVRNEKRFNVAVTRAKALVIVVGNPEVLITDDSWAALLRLAVRNNAYTGSAPLPGGLEAERGGGAPQAAGGAGEQDAGMMSSLARMMRGLAIQGSGRWGSAAAAAEADEMVLAGDGAGARVEGLPMRRLE